MKFLLPVLEILFKVAFVVMVFKSGNLWITSVVEWGIWREEMFCGLMKDAEKKKII